LKRKRNVTDRAVFVYTRFPGLVEAEAAAKVLVERQLAACAGILPPMTSLYRGRQSWNALKKW